MTAGTVGNCCEAEERVSIFPIAPGKSNFAETGVETGHERLRRNGGRFGLSIGVECWMRRLAPQRRARESQVEES